MKIECYNSELCRSKEIQLQIKIVGVLHEGSLGNEFDPILKSSSCTTLELPSVVVNAFL